MSKRITNLRNQFRDEDGGRDREKGSEMLKSYHQFVRDYRENKGIDKKTSISDCNRKRLFDQWVRKEGKTDPEFAYNYWDNWYKEYKPKKYDQWQEKNKGLLTTIIEQRDITTTTNENKRPGYKETWDNNVKGVQDIYDNFEEYEEAAIQYNIDNPPSSSTSTDRNVGEWEVVSEETEEIN